MNKTKRKGADGGKRENSKRGRKNKEGGLCLSGWNKEKRRQER